MTFTHPENVIINQPSPSPGPLLDVQLGGTSKAYIDQDGNVAIGMGSNAPAKIVSIGSPGPNGVAVHSLSNSWMGLQVHRGPLASDEKWFIGLGDTATYGNKLLLRRTASTNDIVIDENGNVGIGAASPSAKLEVGGRMLANVTDPNAYQFLNAGKTEGLVIDTTNKAVRSVTDNVYSLGAGAQRWISLRVGTGDSSFDGNVGIGALVPSEKLEVVGNIKASGNMAAIEGLSGRNLAINGGFKSAPHPVEQSGASILGSEVGSGAGLIQSNSNLQLLRNLVAPGQPGDPDNPPYIYLGLDQDNLLYAFFQYRTDANGGIWGGLETFKRPPAGIGAAWGYGFQPIRMWGKNTKLDEAGQVVARRSIAPVISLLRPKHVDPTTATFQYPDSYNALNRPFKGTTELGGIGYDPADETVQIYRSGTNNDGPDLVFKDVTTGGVEIRLAQLVRGSVNQMKVASGETGLVSNMVPGEERDMGTVMLPPGFFSSPPRVILTPRNSDSAWGITLAAYDVTTTNFGVMGRNNRGVGSASFYIQWIAIGT